MEKEKICAWAYARDNNVPIGVLICQMTQLLADAERSGIQTVGASQDMSSGKTLTRMGLKEALRAIHIGYANTVIVQDVSRLSEDRDTLLCIMEILQDHGTFLICTAEDTYTSLRTKGISQQLYQRSFCMDLTLPLTENIIGHKPITRRNRYDKTKF